MSVVTQRKGETSNIQEEAAKEATKKNIGIQEQKFGEFLSTSRRIYVVNRTFQGVVLLSQMVGWMCVALVAYWCSLYGGFAWKSDANLQFFVHPLLMVLGLIFVYGDAIIVYRVLHFLPNWVLKWIHAALHLFALILSSVGLVAVFENHRRTNKADMYSLHSWVGIATFGFFCLQFVGSVIIFLIPGFPPFMKAKVMPFHTFLGIGIFVLAVGSAQMGLTERLLWTNNYTSGDYIEAGIVGNVLGVSLIVFAFLIVFIATHRGYKRQFLRQKDSAFTK